eukprot:scaffold90657_cov124-Phaeocystis_antarctica.AAC.1
MPGLAWSSPCTPRLCLRSCRSAAAEKPPPTRAPYRRFGTVARAVHQPRRAARAVGARAASKVGPAACRCRSPAHRTGRQRAPAASAPRSTRRACRSPQRRRTRPAAPLTPR